MGLDVIEIFFLWVGRLLWRGLMKLFKISTELSDGSYEVVGFFVCFVVAALIFFGWALNV